MADAEIAKHIQRIDDLEEWRDETIPAIEEHDLMLKGTYTDGQRVPGILEQMTELNRTVTLASHQMHETFDRFGRWARIGGRATIIVFGALLAAGTSAIAYVTTHLHQIVEILRAIDGGVKP